MKKDQATYILMLKDGSYLSDIIEDSEKMAIISYDNKLNAKVMDYNEAVASCIKLVKQLKDINAVTMEVVETI